MSDIVKIDKLCKSFKDVKAVNGLSLRVKRGELFAFLGVNGAGKSTTINIICGITRKDSGSVVIDGSEVGDADTKSAIGVVFQGSVLDPALTVLENLKCRAALYGITGEAFEKRISHLSAILGFKELLGRTLSKLSGGQKRRIDIARALLHSPRLLILDEPTTGLDPQTRTTLWSVIRDLQKSENMTVLLTTHYMEEAEKADYVVIIDEGSICAEGTPLELKNTYTRDYVSLYGASEDDVAALGVDYEKARDGFKLLLDNTRQVTDLIIKHPHVFCDYEITKGKMDDVFLAVTGKKREEV